MSLESALADASAKPAGKRPYFLTREVERVMAITMAIAQELAVTRERLDTLERLLESKKLLVRDEVELYQPSPEAAAERGLWTQEYLARILRIVQQEGEGVVHAAHGDIASEDVAEALLQDD